VRAAHEPPDELDFTPTTDPITGLTLPAFFVAWGQITDETNNGSESHDLPPTELAPA